ncbi:MAG: TetR/AcrR family transcriptional regulator [Actinomycetota bacterium]|nr:TetR/AcrR family transcriptional regulator [Actinomycetota bacterium]
MENRSTLLQQKREFTRSRLLDEALELFRTKGYFATTADDISSAVGCSRATFYLHFKSKSAIMIGILERMWPSVDDSIDEFADEVAAGMTKKQLRVRIAENLAGWDAMAGGISALSVAQLIDPEVAQWLETKNARSVDRLTQAAPGKGGLSTRVLRVRIAILTQMTLAAANVESSRIGGSSAEVVDYLTDLWADLIAV